MSISTNTRNVVGKQLTVHHNKQFFTGLEPVESRFIIASQVGPEQFMVLDPDEFGEVLIDIPKMFGTELEFYTVHELSLDLKESFEKRLQSNLDYIPKKLLELRLKRKRLQRLKQLLNNDLPNTLQT